MTTSAAVRKTSVLVLVAALAASIVVFTAPARAATKNPCKVLTRRQVKQVFAQPVAAPERNDIGDSKECDFEVNGGGFEPGGLTLTVSVARRAIAAELFDDAKVAATNSGGFAFVTDVGVDTPSGSEPCLGDCVGAIFFSSPSGTVQTLIVRTERATFALAVNLSAPPEGAIESATPVPLQAGDPLASEIEHLIALAEKARERV